MKLKELNKIDKLYFGYEDIARTFDIGYSSAKVTASRYVRQGLVLRMKRNLYVRRDVWNAAGINEKFALANLGQVPSYISLTSALEYYLKILDSLNRGRLSFLAKTTSRSPMVLISSFSTSKVSKTLDSGIT